MSVGRFGSYGAIAGLCVLVNFAILMAGERIGIHYVLSTSISFVVCVVIGYGLHSRFTFVARPDATGLFRYTTAMALNLPLSVVALWLFHDLLDQPMVIAAPSSTLVLTLYNFFSSRWAITGRTAQG